MRRLVAACVCLGLMCASAGAWAQSEQGPEARVLEMDGLDVEGDQLSPDASFRAERRGKTSSLITVRQDFIAELVQAVEDL